MCRRVGIALGGIGVRQARHVARELDGRPLEPVADAEVRNAPLARDLGRLHHAARAAVAEPARHEDAVGIVEQRRAAWLLERFGLDPFEIDLQPMREAAVIERFVEALVGILVADVLADDVDRDLVHRMLDPADEVFPLLHPPFGLRQVQMLEDDAIEALLPRAQSALRRSSSTSLAVMTASSSTSQKSAILRLMSESRNRSVRQSRMSGWMPIDRRSRTLCCVGLVLSSPAVPMNGTSVR